MGSKKRKISKNADAEQHMDESYSSEDNCSDENFSEEIQATFEGRNLEDFDIHGIKQLLEQTFVKAHIDISQLADMLINQNGIGSVLKQVSDDEQEINEVEDDDDFNVIYGVTSVLNLSAFRETPCIQQIVSLLKEQVKTYGNEATQKKFHDVLNKNEKIGLLINERFLNIPAAISAPMLSSLQKEIGQIKKRNLSYDFQHYILICKTYSSKKDKGETSFCNDEECIFATYAECSFEYSVEKLAVAGTWKSGDAEVTPFRKVLLFSADKLDDIITQIKNFVQS
ncbi:hypothetical protein WA026_011683 [Henosepilachna vigintioctopunctata]|uniref:Protein BCCIP homolog n=1 Tax=Henosepilachna vigintioctopunctata TaxID=420089 RepID=A0AAW1U9X3_9CUCU